MATDCLPDKENTKADAGSDLPETPENSRHSDAVGVVFEKPKIILDFEGFPLGGFDIQFRGTFGATTEPSRDDPTHPLGEDNVFGDGFQGV